MPSLKNVLAALSSKIQKKPNMVRKKSDYTPSDDDGQLPETSLDDECISPNPGSPGTDFRRSLDRPDKPTSERFQPAKIKAVRGKIFLDKKHCKGNYDHYKLAITNYSEKTKAGIEIADAQFEVSFISDRSGQESLTHKLFTAYLLGSEFVSGTGFDGQGKPMKEFFSGQEFLDDVVAHMGKNTILSAEDKLYNFLERAGLSSWYTESNSGAGLLY